MGAREAGLHLSRGTGVALSVPLIRKEPWIQDLGVHIVLTIRFVGQPKRLRVGPGSFPYFAL